MPAPQLASKLNPGNENSHACIRADTIILILNGPVKIGVTLKKLGKHDFI